MKVVRFEKKGPKTKDTKDKISPASNPPSFFLIFFSKGNCTELGQFSFRRFEREEGKTEGQENGRGEGF